MHGFKNIIMIGDSGGNQNGQKAVADKLTAQFAGSAFVATSNFNRSREWARAAVASFRRPFSTRDASSSSRSIR